MGQTFEELIGLYLDDLYSAALCFTLDASRAEELLQEASVRAFHELSLWGGSDFRLAMLEVLVSTYLQRQRRMGRDPLASDTPPLEELLRAGPQQIEPFPERGTPGYRLLLAWINRVWAELDDGDRLVLWLADIERIRHSSVAAMTGLAEEEVRSRHYRARMFLSRGAADELGTVVGGAEA